MSIVRNFESDCDALERLLFFFCDNPDSDDLYFPRNIRIWEQMLVEIMRLMRNCTATGFEIICADRELRRDGLKPPRGASNEEGTTAEDSVQFFHELSDYCTYDISPLIGTRMTIVDMKSDAIEKHVTFQKDLLLQFDWSDEATAFLKRASVNIDLSKLLRLYRGAVRDCYDCCEDRNMFWHKPE